MTNDLSGVYIDELMTAPVPEPLSAGLVALGLLLMSWAVKRKQLPFRRKSVVTARD
jgi:hypothetical protein